MGGGGGVTSSTREQGGWKAAGLEAFVSAPLVGMSEFLTSKMRWWQSTLDS